MLRQTALFVVCAAAACAPAQTGSESRAIVGGTLDPVDEAIVALVAGDEQFCTGTVVTSKFVVTAAHCLPPHAPFPLEEIEVFLGTDVKEGGRRVAIARARAHPAWTPASLANDIGMVELEASSGVAPIQMAATDNVQLIGASARAVGFGATSVGRGEGGVKRTGSVDIEDVDASTLYLANSQALTCQGDSGGPLLVAGPSGEFLVGIHSRSDCEETSMAERFDVHLAGFVSDFMLANPISAADCGEFCESDGVIGGCNSTAARAPSGSAGWIVLLLAFTAIGTRRRRPGCVRVVPAPSNAIACKSAFSHESAAGTRRALPTVETRTHHPEKDRRDTDA